MCTPRRVRLQPTPFGPLIVGLSHAPELDKKSLCGVILLLRVALSRNADINMHDNKKTTNAFLVQHHTASPARHLYAEYYGGCAAVAANEGVQ